MTIGISASRGSGARPAVRALAPNGNETSGGPLTNQPASAELVAAQETERRRLARELHDVVGQALTAIRLNLLALDAARPPDQPPIPGVADSIATVDALMSQVRMLAFELRPAVLDDLGLAASARSYCRRVAERSGLTITVRARDLDPRPAREIETTAFRILQEAVTNAVRHASAHAIEVSLVAFRRGGDVILDIVDDGVGFEMLGCGDQRCIGIQGMTERAALVGGTLEVRSAPGTGTQVRARLPRHAGISAGAA